jgi:subtilisin family serine protease
MAVIAHGVDSGAGKVLADLAAVWPRAAHDGGAKGRTIPPRPPRIPHAQTGQPAFPDPKPEIRGTWRKRAPNREVGFKPMSSLSKHQRSAPTSLRARLCAAAALAAASAGPAWAQVAPPLLIEDPAPIHVNGIECAARHLMVQLAPGASVGVNARGEPVLRMAKTPRVERASRATFAAARVASVAPLLAAPPKDLALAKALGLDRWHRVTLAADADPIKAHAALAALAGANGPIARVEFDGQGGLAEVPNDPSFGLQWNMLNTGQSVVGVVGTPGADVKVASAWDVTHGDPNLVIAVLDSGIDPHPQLSGRILPGINVPDGTTITSDECSGHGTHVSGILAAAGNDGVGIAGMTWNTKLLPVVIVNGCSGFESNVATGLIWAADQGANLVNMSLQFYLGGTPLRDAVAYAHAQGAVMCAATGNNGNNVIAAPARWSQTIAVAATDNRDIRATFSNFGAETDVSAPGVNVWSLAPGGSYTYKSGTSMSVPHVTGLAALLWSAAPTLTHLEVRALIEQGVKDLGTVGRDDLYGLGRVDAAASFALLFPALPEDLNGDGAVNAQDLAVLLSAWGPCANCDACVADLNGDCTVGPQDLAQLLSAW